jgi:hypothetical protein
MMKCLEMQVCLYINVLAVSLICTNGNLNLCGIYCFIDLTDFVMR